jgi:DNA-binding NarL/FixJ family response regulator
MLETTPDHRRPVTTALVSRPGIMQQSLRASLAACPGIEIVAAWGDGLTALTHVTEHAPALLVIDCNLLDEEVETLLDAVKARQAAIRCLIFTRSTQRASWAWASGADAVVPRDGSLKELMSVVAQLQET